MYIGQTATKFKGAKPYMARKFIAQRGQQNLNNDQQINRVRHTSDVRYSLDEAIEIFIQAKEAEKEYVRVPLMVIMIRLDILRIG